MSFPRSLKTVEIKLAHQKIPYTTFMAGCFTPVLPTTKSDFYLILVHKSFAVDVKVYADDNALVSVHGR